MASNEYLNVAELIKDYYDAPIGAYLNQTVTINEVSLPCDIYRVAAETVLTGSVFTGCTANDANTQIVIGKDMSVASGTTLTPPYRCKGIIIGDVGTFTNSGTISMTARGASGAGKNIKLVKNYQISATGGAGGTKSFRVQYHNTGQGGTDGSAPSTSVLSCGGGGSGAVTGEAGYTYTAGSGGTGTSFSGGTGGGGIAGSSTSKTGNNGSSTGGAGGDGLASGGGAGNPKGTNNQVDLIDSAEATGTGGLIVIITNKIINSGSITSQGSRANGFASGYTPTRGNYSTGGSSGGGCIVLISRERELTGTISVAGGATPSGSGSSSWVVVGGAGGAGAYSSYLVEDLVLVNLPVEIAVTDSNHLDNIDLSEAVRLIGLTDKDEMYYDIMGIRHKVGGGHSISDSTTTLTQRKVLEMDAPLTAEDDSTNEVTKVGVDTNVDLSGFSVPGTEHNATDGSPVGTIISFFGYAAPNGYLVCDGTEYARADYPYLSAHLAALDTHYSTTTYNGSDANHFKVPDLRGEFLRGTGTNSHTNQGNGGNVGVHQDATLQANLCVWDKTVIVPIANDGSTFNTQTVNTDSHVNRVGNLNASSSSFSYGASTSSYESDSPQYTSRPTNTSVLYCIKYS